MGADPDAEVDSWEWAGPAVLDAIAGNSAKAWLERHDGFVSLGEEEAYPAHVDELRKAPSRRDG